MPPLLKPIANREKNLKTRATLMPLMVTKALVTVPRLMWMLKASWFARWLLLVPMCMTVRVYCLSVLVGDEQTVGADSGYVGKEKDLKALGIQPRIIKRRVRGKQHEPTPELTASQKRFNGLVSKEILGLAFGYNGRRYGFLVRGGVEGVVCGV